MSACFNGNLGVVRALLAAGADKDAQSGVSGGGNGKGAGSAVEFI